MTARGYAGGVLWVDLTRERVHTEPLSQEMIERYLGGAGFCARYLCEGMPGDTPWDDPDSLLVLAAGPFGNPNRFEGGAEATMAKQGRMTPLDGAFERPLNIYRCAYAYVNQSRSWLPDPIGGVSWVGLDRPATSVLVPLYAGGLGVPRSLEVADVLRVDRDSMWTAFNYVANYAMLKYSYMIKDIRAEQGRFEARGFGGRQDVEARALALWNNEDEPGARRLLTEHSASFADELLASWWRLADRLYITYNDGYINTEDAIGQPVFYPSWWLEAVGYQNGPQSYQKPADQ